MIGWFREVMRESFQGLYSDQMHRTFRMGMFWFISSEIWFFAALFAALFYARWVSAPWLGGVDGYREATRDFLYPHFIYQWPLLQNPDPQLYPGPSGQISPWGLPFYNTLVLISSAVTLTIAHYQLLKGCFKRSAFFLSITSLLGIVFLYFQYQEYAHAMNHLNLLLSSGIYASTFYMITGFHGLHVLIGTVFLSVITVRTFKGHFSLGHHFAFEAAAWYWHFVDTIWWAVYLFVYCV
jgi:cytochrome c oxidase subunit 3